MKKTPFLLALLCLIFSCKKNDTVNPDDIRLTKVQYHNNNDISSYSYDYDVQGRITGISYSLNNGTSSSFVTISYNGSELLLVSKPDNNSSLNATDSVWITLDMERKPLKRIEHQFYEFFPPVNIAQRTYSYDTLTYSYDGSGILTRIDQKKLDTTWGSTNGDYVDRTTGVSNYTASGGNITGATKNFAVSSWTKQNGNVYTSSQSHEKTLTFSYAKKYANKLDFSNVAILNEYFEFYEYPLNRHLANLPEKINISETDKDQNGVVYHSGSSQIDFTLSYNRYGFLSTLMTDPATPALRTEFFYNK